MTIELQFRSYCLPSQSTNLLRVLDWKGENVWIDIYNSLRKNGAFWEDMQVFFSLRKKYFSLLCLSNEWMYEFVIIIFKCLLKLNQETCSLHCSIIYHGAEYWRTLIIIFLILTASTRIPLIAMVVCLFVCLMVSNATFNNFSVISWRSGLLVEETEGSGENHRRIMW